jgi:hypothetical protein
MVQNSSMEATAKIPFKFYIITFIFLCFCGNPLFFQGDVGKLLFVCFSVLFIAAIIKDLPVEALKVSFFQFLKISLIVFLLCYFQFFSLGFVSFPGVFVLLLKVLLGMFVLVFFQHNNLSFYHLYIKTISFLVIISLPFFILNYFTDFGIPLDNPNIKSLLFYTSYDFSFEEIRNSGMFWEPGAFAGYLNFGLLFMALQNKKFVVGDYKKEAFWIIVGIITTMSTTGYIVLAMILLLSIVQYYRRGKFILLPLLISAAYYAYFRVDFLNEKIEKQYELAAEMSRDETSNTRFGALTMDLIYIQDKPIIGNGLDARTRFRFHPWIKEDIGHGNGMSNFIVWWGIPFFLLWLYCLFSVVYKETLSVQTAILFTFLVLLILQGEQFLNYPLFLIFFIAPAVTTVSKIEDPVSYHKLLL